MNFCGFFMAIRDTFRSGEGTLASQGAAGETPPPEALLRFVRVCRDARPDLSAAR